MKKVLGALKKNWIRVWLVAAAAICICTVFFAVADYTEVSSIKRVISTKDSPKDPFSSNCMLTDLSSRRMSSTTFYVTVCNYDQDQPLSPSTIAIDYRLFAWLAVRVGDDYIKLSDLSDAQKRGEEGITEQQYNAWKAKAQANDVNDPGYTVKRSGETALRFTEDNNFSVTLPDQTGGVSYTRLPALKSTADVYEVTIPRVDLSAANDQSEQFFVYLEAVPKNDTFSTLRTRLYGAPTEENESSWSGEILESDPANRDYDFYNYIITGSGQGSLDILWDDTKFEINKFFLEQNGITAGDIHPFPAGDEDHPEYANFKYFTITGVDSREKSRYEIQLYKVSENTSITTPAASVGCIFHKAETGS